MNLEMLDQRIHRLRLHRLLGPILHHLVLEEEILLLEILHLIHH
jgi:hypothetical protein